MSTSYDRAAHAAEVAAQKADHDAMDARRREWAIEDAKAAGKWAEVSRLTGEDVGTN